MQRFEYKGNATSIYLIFRITMFLTLVTFIAISFRTSNNPPRIFNGFIIKLGINNIFCLVYIYQAIFTKNLFQMQMYIVIQLLYLFGLLSPIIFIYNIRENKALVIPLITQVGILLIEMIYAFIQNKEFRKIFRVYYFKKFGENEIINSKLINN